MVIRLFAGVLTLVATILLNLISLGIALATLAITFWVFWTLVLWGLIALGWVVDFLF